MRHRRIGIHERVGYYLTVRHLVLFLPPITAIIWAFIGGTLNCECNLFVLSFFFFLLFWLRRLALSGDLYFSCSLPFCSSTFSQTFYWVRGTTVSARDTVGNEAPFTCGTSQTEKDHLRCIAADSLRCLGSVQVQAVLGQEGILDSFKIPSVSVSFWDSES